MPRMRLAEISAEIALMGADLNDFHYSNEWDLMLYRDRIIVDVYDINCILYWKKEYSKEVWDEYEKYGKEVHDNGTYVNCWGFVNHMAKEAVRRFCVKHPEYMSSTGMSFIRRVAEI